MLCSKERTSFKWRVYITPGEVGDYREVSRRTQSLWDVGIEKKNTFWTSTSTKSEAHGDSKTSFIILGKLRDGRPQVYLQQNTFFTKTPRRLRLYLDKNVRSNQHNGDGRNMRHTVKNDWNEALNREDF